MSNVTRWRSTMLAGAILAGGLMSSAWALTTEEFARAEANFKAANPGGTTLNHAQFKAFIDLNATGKIGRAAQIKSNNAYDRAFGVVDANKDGSITWDEYVKAQ